jgi:hypothetical protein
VGGFEVGILVSMEPTLKYHPDQFGNLTCTREPGGGHRLMGSLTGAVASQRVTEARDGGLRTVGNRLLECNGISPPDCETDKSSRDESRS